MFLKQKKIKINQVRMNNSVKRNKILKASSLGYAVSFLLLIGLVSSGLLFITSVNKRLEMNYTLEDHMLLNNYMSLKYGATKENNCNLQLIHNSGDTSNVSVKKWGAFKAVVSRTKHQYKNYTRSAIVGNELIGKHPVMYLPNQRNEIKLCGESVIVGDIYISRKGISRGHISGKPFLGDVLFKGQKFESERSLPPLNKQALEVSFKDFIGKSIKIDLPQKDTTFSFNNETRMINSSQSITITNSVIGNCVIHSFDSIYVSSTATLEHVILFAPVIYFEKGFKGKVQAFASKKIICENNVKLEYPSTIVLIETEDELGQKHGIYLQKESSVIGGVLLISRLPNFRKPIELIIDNSIVGGLVYNQGVTELKGEIIGHIYTSSFRLNYGGGQYLNYLLDAKLSSEKLPEGFILPNWLEKDKSNGSKIIQCF